jgi:hypothetical protein
VSVKQLALVTYRGCSDLTEDDRLLIPILCTIGVEAKPVVWDDMGASSPSHPSRGPVMVQEFVPEVQTLGEWSLIFLGGEFSHAIRKFPATGDFRVQTQFGGTVLASAAKSQFVDHAAGVLEAIDERTLYARVDGIEREGEFVLMELELIELVLFLGLGKADNDFAQKIASSMS